MSPCEPRREARPVSVSLPVLPAAVPGAKRAAFGSRTGWKRAAVLAGVWAFMIVHLVQWLAMGTTLAPIEPSESMETVKNGVVTVGAIFFAAALLSTALLGRWFCGWGCHWVAIQDGTAWLLAKAGIRPRPFRSRLLAWMPLCLAIYMFVWPLFYRFAVAPWVQSDLRWPGLSVHFVTQEFWATFPGWMMGIPFVLVSGVLVVWLLGTKGYCTYACPYGGFFAPLDELAPMRIVVDHDRCEQCGHCTAVCTSNVRVHEEVAKHGQIVDPGCMKCLDCVSVCPKDALSVGLALPKPFAVSQQRIAARADFTWPEEVALAVVAFATAQWGFRGAWFGEGVPFLMAVGLGAITAVFALLAWRLVRARDVAFQHRELKRHGALLPAGRLALLAIAGWLLFTAHTGWGKRLRDGALAAAREPVRASFYQTGPVAAGDLQQTLAGVEAARAWTLGDEPLLREVGALLLRGLGRHVDAEKELLAIRGDAPTLDLPEANLALAAYCMDPRRQRFDDARALVAQALRTQPDNVVAKLLQQRLDALPPASK